MCSVSEIAVDWMIVSPFYSYLFFFQPIHGYFITQSVRISYTTAIAVYTFFVFLLLSYKPWCLKKFIKGIVRMLKSQWHVKFYIQT